MPKNNADLVNYDEVKQLRKNVITIALLAIATFVLIFCVVRYHEIQGLKHDIAEKQSEKKAVEKHNKSVDKKQHDQLNTVGLSQVKDDMNNFNELFFKWSTWGEYSKNMKELRESYPSIQKGDVVNISAKNVGSGQSPKSTYQNDFLTTTNKEEIAEIVDQSKDFGNGNSETLWYIIGDKKGGATFNVTKMSHYQEVDTN